jgi:hypothetical protein
VLPSPGAISRADTALEALRNLQLHGKGGDDGVGPERVEGWVEGVGRPRPVSGECYARALEEAREREGREVEKGDERVEDEDGEEMGDEGVEGGEEGGEEDGGEGEGEGKVEEEKEERKEEDDLDGIDVFRHPTRRWSWNREEAKRKKFVERFGDCIVEGKKTADKS